MIYSMKNGVIMKSLVLSFIFLLSSMGVAKQLSVYSLPMTCTELIPDQEPFVLFFESAARGSVAKDRNFSKRLFKLVSLRRKINETPDKLRETNPIDQLIRKTLCFYREQKEPIKPVPFDDEKFISFLRASLPELEAKAKDAVFETEYLRATKKQYEAKLKQNESLVEQLESQARNEANQEYDQLKAQASKKVVN